MQHMSNTEPGFLPEKLKQMQLASLGLGTLGIVVMLMAHKLPNFYQGYLVGWLFAMSFALGGLLIYLAFRPQARARLDLTARATYTLSERTLKVLDDLQQDVEIITSNAATRPGRS